mmetsp:Transcript_33154/g.47066  ORF Transcript_33154/g.47066 Transcript_33154/m.47066 type:complete len:105 (-) Transcript_33154:100-414(-)
MSVYRSTDGDTWHAGTHILSAIIHQFRSELCFPICHFKRQEAGFKDARVGWNNSVCYTCTCLVYLYYGYFHSIPVCVALERESDVIGTKWTKEKDTQKDNKQDS